MTPARNLVLLLLVISSLTSCFMTESVRSTQIEIMKPGVFIIPEEQNTVAIFKRDKYQSDTTAFRYYNGQIITDRSIRYHDLSNSCVDALSHYFEQEGYFKKVINYRDSLNILEGKAQQKKKSGNIFEETQADICIFLDYFNFSFTTVFKSEETVHTRPCLSWNIVFKNDSTSYIYNQLDTLTYDGIQFPEYFTSNKVRMDLIMQNASEYLAKFFGSKIVPTWLPAERMYYTSNNPDMLKAEKFALNNNWLKAAEIWNKEAKNKNKRIAAKATFNMAVACEMEGKHDLAIDWLVRSYSGLPENSENSKDHRLNCQRYINVLAMRKKEIERLSKQVRNPGEN